MIAPHDVTATRTALEWLAQDSGRSMCISSADGGAWWYVTAHVGAKSYTASNPSLAIAIREAIRGTR